MTTQNCRKLEKNGYVVVDNFLSGDEVRGAAQAIRQLRNEGKFHTTQNEVDYKNSQSEGAGDMEEGEEADPEPVRTDEVIFYDAIAAAAAADAADAGRASASNGNSAQEVVGAPSSADSISHSQSNSCSLRLVQLQLRKLAHELVAHSEFRGFDEDEEGRGSSVAHQPSSWVGVPMRMQISNYSSSFDGGAGGSFYREHYDACSDSWMSLGLLGYLKSLYLRRRYITIIVYLNDGWPSSSPNDGSHNSNNNNSSNAATQQKQRHRGGCLRMFRADGSYLDIEPLAGRLLIFSSVHRKHAVMPTYHHERFACSMWLTLNAT
jgi:hypothetical protein